MIFLHLLILCASRLKHVVEGAEASEAVEQYDHFARTSIKRYFESHNNAQGIAVLGFELLPGELDILHTRYETQHPKLVAASPRTYADGTRVLDVFAYYNGEALVSEAPPDSIGGRKLESGEILRPCHLGEVPGLG